MEGATRKDVTITESADTIRYNVSRLTREYLLYLLYPKKKTLKQSLLTHLDRLDEEMRTIAITTKDPKTKGVLKYFAYEKVRIEGLMKQKPSRDHVATLMEFSETFTEGAAAIARRHRYVPTPEEAMWIATRLLDQDIEEVIKYYIARRIVRDDPELTRKLTASAAQFRQQLQKINQYDYTGDLARTRNRLNTLWDTLETYVAKADTLPIPIVVTLMGEALESSIDTLGIFHSKNQ